MARTPGKDELTVAALTEQRDSDGGSTKPKKRWYKRPAIMVPLTILLVLVIGAGATFGYYVNLSSKVNHVEVNLPKADNSASESSSAKDVNYLILGSDSRESGGDPTDWRYGAQRSDVMMLMNISADRQHVTTMSIPRDSWVQVPDHGMAKINAAYSYGGADLTVSTVQNLTGVHIDHFVIVDFESFKQITDLLGGVDIATSQGTQHMDGATALKFVRERYSLPRGDFDRVRRQQAWIRAIVTAGRQQNVLSSATSINQYLNAILQHSAVDPSLTLQTMASQAVELRNLPAGGVQFMTAPVTGTGNEGGQSVVYLDYSRLNPLCAAWAGGTLNSYIQQNASNLEILGDTGVA